MAEKDVLESITTRIDKLSPKEKSDDELYAKRLNECKNCEHLISGVCMKCGCY
jgi:ribosomal protein L32